MRNPNNNRRDLPAPKSVWMGGIGYECQAFHYGKQNAHIIISQSDTYLRW